MIRVKRTQEESEILINETCNTLNSKVESFIYKNETTRIFATCNICEHAWNSSFKHFVKLESKCKICNNIKNKRLTIDEVIKNLKHKNPQIEILSNEYINSKTLLRCRCIKCGSEFKSTYTNLIDSSKTNGCVECEKRKSWVRKCKTQENFEKDVFKAHGNKISIIGVYTMGRNKIETKCNLCNLVWFSEAKGLIKGYGCPDCGHEKNRNSTVKNIDWLNDKVYEIHRDRLKIINGQYINGSSVFKIKCNICNHTWDSTGFNIRHRGCPACNLSKGEMKIKDCLDDINIKYEQQKIINEKTPKGGTSSFDFYLTEFNCAIEYDGQQHYVSVKKWGGDKKLQDQQDVDQFKNNYCHDNSIKLIRIPYYEFKEINNEYLKNKIYE